MCSMVLRHSVLAILPLTVSISRWTANLIRCWLGAISLHRCVLVRGSSVSVRMRSGTLTGTAGQGLVSVAGGSLASLGLKEVTLDGPISGIVGAANGTCMVSHSTLTLLNGASLSDGGVRGENIIYN